MEIEERVALLNERDQLQQAIQRVRELHIKGTSPFGNNYEVCIWCSGNCEHEGGTDIYWPCPTIKALDGEQ